MENKYWGQIGDRYGTPAEFTCVARWDVPGGTHQYITNWIAQETIWAILETPGADVPWTLYAFAPHVAGTHFPYGYPVVPG